MTTFTTDIIMVAFVTNATTVSAVIVAAVVTINVLFTKGYHGYCGYVYIPEVFYCANISYLITIYSHSYSLIASDAVFTDTSLVLSAEYSTAECVSD
jgi:hypothetical protein